MNMTFIPVSSVDVEIAYIAKAIITINLVLRLESLSSGKIINVVGTNI